MIKPGPAWPKNTIFWLSFFFLFFSACGEGPPETMPVVEKKFRTTPPSRIYFKNIRSTAYEWEQDRDTRTDYYLLRKIANQSPKPQLYPVIADIWMEDQAQVILRSGENISPEIPAVVYWQSRQDSGSYHLDTLNAGNMYRVGLGIYESLRKSHALEVSFADGARAPLFRDAAERNHFLISMQDYLRLTEFY